eukprot:scaffold271_cov252-Pinguiococcus_pyrenoidosus.AAC.11
MKVYACGSPGRIRSDRLCRMPASWMWYREVMSGTTLPIDDGHQRRRERGTTTSTSSPSQPHDNKQSTLDWRSTTHGSPGPPRRRRPARLPAGLSRWCCLGSGPLKRTTGAIESHIQLRR